MTGRAKRMMWTGCKYASLATRQYAVVAIAGCLSVGCTAAQKRPAVAATLENTETRHESFEATLRVLDAHPEYVDELFMHALEHPATLDRLLHDTAQHLHEGTLATRTAAQLAETPAGLKATLIAALERIQERPAAMQAAAEAIEERPELTVAALVTRDIAVRRTVHALVQEAQHNPQARRAFLAAMDENRVGTAAVLTSDPAVMADLFKAIAKSGVRRGKNEFETFLSALDD
jgi:hypothetical protein